MARRQQKKSNKIGTSFVTVCSFRINKKFLDTKLFGHYMAKGWTPDQPMCTFPKYFQVGTSCLYRMTLYAVPLQLTFTKIKRTKHFKA